MNRLKAMLTGAVLAALVTSGAVFAQGPRGGGPGFGRGGPGGPGGRASAPAPELRGLNLTDAQEQQIRDIRQQDRAGMQELQQKLRAASEAREDAIQRVPVDEGLIRQTTQSLADIQAEVAIRQAQVHSQVWAVLTPAQQAEVTRRRAERDARQQERQQDRAERRPGRQAQ